MKQDKFALKKILFLITFFFLIFTCSIYAQPVIWNNSSSSVQWYTASNWTPATSRTGWTTTSVATFSNAGTRTIGINMASGSLAMQGIAVNHSSLAASSITVGNSSATPGTLTLYGPADGTIINVDNAALNLNSTTPTGIAV